MVMKGVLEEKTNRIMEVMASSVKPFDLLFGKVTAVGAIGITQIVLWGILLLALSSALMPLLVGAEVPDPQAISGLQATPQQPTPGEVSNVISALRSFNFAILLFFPIFFIGGFLVYGSLYAGLAASADQESDVQALSFLVFFPLIITVILMGAVIENPNGGLALFMSLFPLFSPIIMPLRMAATDVPMWQTLLSILLLCGGVVGLVALASRIYRAGMLIYGQKPSLKTLYRWVIRGQ
jgi:ABC-2 type transport system permease protein